jgi:hypothetical protein
VILQLPEPLNLRNGSRGRTSRGLCCSRILQEVIFARTTLVLLGLVKAVSRSLKMQAISETPSQGCNVAPHGSSKRKKKLIARTAHMLSLQDVRAHRCPTPAVPLHPSTIRIRLFDLWQAARSWLSFGVECRKRNSLNLACPVWAQQESALSR